jgi:hypothetical protein
MHAVRRWKARRCGLARRGRRRRPRRSRSAVAGVGSLVRSFANTIVDGAPVSNRVVSKRPIAVEGRLVARDRGRRGGPCRLGHAGLGRCGGRENQRGDGRASTSNTHGEDSPRTSGTRPEQGTFYLRAAGARAMRPGKGRAGLEASGWSLEAAECGGRARGTDCRKALAGRRQEHDELCAMAGKRRCCTHGRTQVAHRRAAGRPRGAGHVVIHPMMRMVCERGRRLVGVLVIPGRRVRMAAIAWFMRLAHRRRGRTAHVAEQAGCSHCAPEREQQGNRQKEARSGLHAGQASTLAAPGQRDAKLRAPAVGAANVVAIIGRGAAAAHHVSKSCPRTSRIARLHGVGWANMPSVGLRRAWLTASPSAAATHSR